MKFRSRNGDTKRIATTDGHCAIVTEEWRELPEHLHEAAYAAGCMSDEGIQPGGGPNETIVAAIKTMLASNNPDDFTKAGLPDKNVLSKVVGFKVGTEMFDVAWDAVQAEAQ